MYQEHLSSCPLLVGAAASIAASSAVWWWATRLDRSSSAVDTTNHSDETHQSVSSFAKPICTLETYEHASITDAELFKLYERPAFQQWLLQDRARTIAALARQWRSRVVLAVCLLALLYLALTKVPFHHLNVDWEATVLSTTTTTAAVAGSYEASLRQALSHAPRSLVLFLRDPVALWVATWSRGSDVVPTDKTTEEVGLGQVEDALPPPSLLSLPGESDWQWHGGLVALMGVVLLSGSLVALCVPAGYVAGEATVPLGEQRPVGEVMAEREERARLAAVVGFVLMCAALGVVGFGVGFLMLAACVAVRVFWAPSFTL